MDNELQQNLDAILLDKNTNLKPENLKSGVTCLGVEGTLSKGTDTSDATATIYDILYGKTAYGPYGKMTGTIINNASYSPLFVDTNVNVSTKQVQKSSEDPTMTDVLEFSNQNLNKSVQKYLYTSIELNAEFADVANVIGLTAEKLVKGNTILGVEGTASAGLDTSDANATIKDILENKTAYVNGEKLTGTMTNNGDKVIVPNTDEQDFSAGYYNSVQVRPVTATVDENIKAENIKVGIDILGVSGTVVELNGHELEVTPSTKQKVITPEENYNAITKVTVSAVTSEIDANILPENIKAGVTILGVTGTYTGG